jgi:hypothetical protein
MRGEEKKGDKETHAGPPLEDDAATELPHHHHTISLTGVGEEEPKTSSSSSNHGGAHKVNLPPSLGHSETSCCR